MRGYFYRVAETFGALQEKDQRSQDRQEKNPGQKAISEEPDDQEKVGRKGQACAKENSHQGKKESEPSEKESQSCQEDDFGGKEEKEESPDPEEDGRQKRAPEDDLQKGAREDHSTPQDNAEIESHNDDRTGVGYRPVHRPAWRVVYERQAAPALPQYSAYLEAAADAGG